MLNDRSSHAREDRVDRPPPATRFIPWLLGACLCGSLASASSAEAQTRPAPNAPAHPAFTAKLRDAARYRVDPTLNEDICPGSGSLQHVRDYDGTLGQSRAFVDGHENPVGLLGGYCSGTLIARNLFLTASHCVDSQTAGNTSVTFEYEKLAGSSQTAPTTSFQVVRVTQEGADEGLDFAILELSGSPGDTFGVTEIEQFRPALEHLITIIQHPGGDRKMVEVGHVHSFSGDYLRYDDLDTNPGSSGSGVLDDRGRLIGVHTQGGCAGGEQNSGVSMDRIIARSAVIRGLLPPTILAREGRLTLLRVHDVGTGYGPPGDSIDAETIVWLDQTGSEPYGFTLRSGTDADTHRQMFGALRDAYRLDVPVRIEYDRETHRTNRILRVVRK